MGLVNQYRDMSTRFVHTLNYLTNLGPTNVKFKWTDIWQKAFDKINHNLVRYTLLAYPYFNKLFDINKYAINLQLLVVINREVKPITFYIRKNFSP